MNEHEIEWDKLSPEEKKEQLYLRQKALLDTFLEKNAISKEQYDKSLGDLTEKMGFGNKAIASNDWRSQCEDGSRFGLDPNDYDSQSAYEYDLDTAKAFEAVGKALLLDTDEFDVQKEDIVESN